MREFPLQLSAGSQSPGVGGVGWVGWVAVEGLGPADRDLLGAVRHAGGGSEGERTRSAGHPSKAGLDAL